MTTGTPLAPLAADDARRAAQAAQAAQAALAAMETLRCAAREAARWPADERRRLIGDMDRAVDGLTAVRAAVLLAEREAGTWQGDGDASFEAWRSRTGRTTKRSAVVQVRAAEHLQAVPSVVDAVAAGRITLDHATAIATVAGSGTPAQQEAVLARGAQEELLALAERTDAGTFATTVARWAATTDPARLEDGHEAQRRARYLHVATTSSGTFIKGRLDAISGHRLDLALEALTPRPAPDDDRDLGQRRADALDAMAGRILSDADTKPGAHVPPHVSLILTAETWDAARTERDRRRAAVTRAGSNISRMVESGAEREPGDVDAPTQPTRPAPRLEAVAAPPATLEDGTPVPTTELAVAMCDCAVTRVAVDADGAPLDLGRTARVFSGPQRRAVIARDRKCIWPDCHMPARWCQIHHTRWWERDGGRTAVDEGVLLCNFHHHEVHRRDLAVTRLPAARKPPPALGEPRGRPAAVSTVARAAYEFRDRAGRLIGRPTEPPGAQPPGAQPPGAAPPDADGLELTRTVDPFTGMPVPALMLHL